MFQHDYVIEALIIRKRKPFRELLSAILLSPTLLDFEAVEELINLPFVLKPKRGAEFVTQVLLSPSFLEQFTSTEIAKVVFDFLLLRLDNCTALTKELAIAPIFNAFLAFSSNKLIPTQLSKLAVAVLSNAFIQEINPTNLVLAFYPPTLLPSTVDAALAVLTKLIKKLLVKIPKEQICNTLYNLLFVVESPLSIVKILKIIGTYDPKNFQLISQMILRKRFLGGRSHVTANNLYTQLLRTKKLQPCEAIVRYCADLIFEEGDQQILPTEPQRFRQNACFGLFFELTCVLDVEDLSRLVQQLLLSLLGGTWGQKMFLKGTSFLLWLISVCVWQNKLLTDTKSGQDSRFSSAVSKQSSKDQATRSGVEADSSETEARPVQPQPTREPSGSSSEDEFKETKDLQAQTIIEKEVKFESLKPA